MAKRTIRQVILTGAAFVLLSSERVGAHGLGGDGVRETVTLPAWLILMTGGAVVGASFLLSSFLTDRAAIDGLRRANLTLPDSICRVGRIGRGLGVVALLALVGIGFLGPQTGTNLAVLVILVGWWAGYVATVYLIGNTWPALDPMQALAGKLPSFDRSYPDRLGAWPSVLGLFLLLWVELASPIDRRPRVLAAALVAYIVIGAAVLVTFGRPTWFRSVDPITRLFRYLGAVAPLQKTARGWRLKLPGANLTRFSISGVDERAFVLAILWATTFDGLVHTATWNESLRAIIGLGIPPIVVYSVGFGTGFILFWGAFRLSIQLGRARANTHLPFGVLADRFAVSLIPIAAGYHLAHSLGYFLAWTPTLLSSAAKPFSPNVAITVLAIPPWFDSIGMLAILAGHLVGVWAAHAIAYDLFPGRLQALRSQFGLVAVMVLYTATSLWIVSQPSVPPVALGT